MNTAIKLVDARRALRSKCRQVAIENTKEVAR